MRCYWSANYLQSEFPYSCLCKLFIYLLTDELAKALTSLVPPITLSPFLPPLWYPAIRILQMCRSPNTSFPACSVPLSPSGLLQLWRTNLGGRKRYCWSLVGYRTDWIQQEGRSDGCYTSGTVRWKMKIEFERFISWSARLMSQVLHFVSWLCLATHSQMHIYKKVITLCL